MSLSSIGSKVLAAAVVCVALTSAAQASDKQAVFEKLIAEDGTCGAESASLMTCGLIALNKRLDVVEPTLGADMVATYDVESGTIKVQATSVQGLHATEENCRNVVNTLRYDAGVDGRRGWLLTDYATRWTYGFLPPMTSRTQTRTEQEEILDSAYSVDVLIQHNDKRVECRGPVLSKDIVVSG